ncbi:ParA family protein [Deinococcus oregonensis]|uniref:ParA family protein n=1 Tax=Deinococcus oregonensis TaxID=1805970 RepID=A0ABV6AV57_9DEIO
MTVIIGVISFKGGVGKTSSAIHIAGHLAERGATIGVDGDDRNRSMMTWAESGHLPFQVMSLMEALSNRSEYLVVDVRGGLPDVELFDLARSCDLLLIPANPEVMSLDGLRRTFDVLRDEADRTGTPWRAKVAAMLTMARPGRKLLEAQAALHTLGIPVLDTCVRASEAFRDASMQGVLVKEVRTNALAGACWADYGSVVQESLQLIGGEA